LGDFLDDQDKLFALLVCAMQKRVSLFFLIFLLLGSFASKALNSEENFDNWKSVLELLHQKKGVPPQHIRLHLRRSPDDGYKDLKRIMDETEAEVKLSTDIALSSKQKQTPSVTKLDTIESFQKKMEILKRDVAMKQTNDGVGQIMRGESAKQLYLAQSTPKYDTVEGFSSKLQQRSQTNHTSPKHSEVVILKSMPKSQSHFSLANSFISRKSSSINFSETAFKRRTKSKIC
jgi:hypothetical protein